MEYAPIADPAGPIAVAERDLLYAAFLVMMIVVIPVFVLAAFFAYRYRANGGKGTHDPEWSYSAKIDAVIWIVPTIIVIALGYFLWTSTYKLNPYRPLRSDIPALEIQAVALDWKWLFIYPQYGIATVNEVAMPVDRPVAFKITSDTVMNSFSIPALAGQIFAMAGMTTQLHLLASKEGTFRGSNTQYSGDGFANQHFSAVAMTNNNFEAWTKKVGEAGAALDAAAYARLEKPSIGHPVEYYSSYEPGLFGTILIKYAASQDPADLVCTASVQDRQIN